jgi:hypothetical protein
MKTSEVVERVSSGQCSFSAVAGEIKEVFQARTVGEFLDECCDVYGMFLCWLYINHNIDLEMRWMRSAEVWFKRVAVWEEIFDREGLVFNNKYLVNGGNYKRPYKVEMALELARKDK